MTEVHAPDVYRAHALRVIDLLVDEWQRAMIDFTLMTVVTCLR